MNAPEQRLLPLASADALWAEMQATESRERLSGLWLRWLAGLLPTCPAGVVLLDDGQGTLVATAVMPEGNDGQGFKAIATQAVQLRALAVQATPRGHELALPLLLAGRARGAVAILLPGSDAAAVWHAAATMRWGMGWLRAALGGLAGAPAADAVRAAQEAQLARARLALDLSLAVLNQPDFKSAAMLLASRLARAFGCSMVQLGWSERSGSRLVARSDSAWHDSRSDLVRAAEQAMDEALDQACSLCLPLPEPTQSLAGGPLPGEPAPPHAAGPQPAPVPLLVAGKADAARVAARPAAAAPAPASPSEIPTEPSASAWEGAAAPDALLARAAQAHYLRSAAVGAVLTVPLPAGGPQVGALLFERDAAFTADDVEAAETLAAMLGPLLLLRHQGDESVWAHLRRKGRAGLAWALGERHAGWKLLGTSAALLLAVAAVWPVTHRVSAPSVIEGQTQRAAVAPFEGYLLAAQARAGDTVRAGQVLASLDDRDLQLERQHWQAELEVATRKEREALASADRVALRQAGAQAESTRAQLDLVQEKLRRLDIVAPFDGVVVRGDLSQRLGSPVQVGDVLFELAPLEAWRVILKVDERDIARVMPGQRGELVLAGLPGQRLSLQAQRVLSVAEAEDGRNQFRVEAAVDAGPARLRPGMEGVAKLDVGEASLLWVWTHRGVDWLRRTLWEWMP